MMSGASVSPCRAWSSARAGISRLGFARTLMARIWEPGVVTVKTTEREGLVGEDPATYFWTPHHDRSPKLVLVRLPNVKADELAELLEESYRIAGPSKARSPGPGV